MRFDGDDHLARGRVRDQFAQTVDQQAAQRVPIVGTAARRGVDARRLALPRQIHGQIHGALEATHVVRGRLLGHQAPVARQGRQFQFMHVQQPGDVFAVSGVQTVQFNGVPGDDSQLHAVVAHLGQTGDNRVHGDVGHAPRTESEFHNLTGLVSKNAPSPRNGPHPERFWAANGESG